MSRRKTQYPGSISVFRLKFKKEYHKDVYILFVSLYNELVAQATTVFDTFPLSGSEKIFSKEQPLAKPNFDFQKRQKEIAKKKKNEEKKQRKLEKNAAAAAENPVQSPHEGDDR